LANCETLGRSRLPYRRREHLPEAIEHGGHQMRRICPVRHGIGVREQVPFEVSRRRVDRQHGPHVPGRLDERCSIAQPVLLEHFRHLRDRQAFGERDVDPIDVASSDLANDV
jgi:hypothetical protein